MGLIELGSVLGLSNIVAGRLLSKEELPGVRVLYLSRTTRLHDRIGELYDGSHRILQSALGQMLHNSNTIVMRVNQISRPNDPFIIKRAIERSVIYNYQSWPDSPEEDETRSFPGAFLGT